jgi:shikimate dehydrogenase
MNQLGLIGYPLTHSFSKKYFTEKFEREGIENWQYELYPLAEIAELTHLLRGGKNEVKNLVGINVTIPYKEAVLPYLQALEAEAAEIGAVNCIKIDANGHLKGYNTDVYGFERSLRELLGEAKPKRGLVLGTGGAAKGVFFVLKKMGIEPLYVSRNGSNNGITYQDLTEEVMQRHDLIVNTTPLGMLPNVETVAPIPFKWVNVQHYLYDLVYNPIETMFLHLGKERGATVKNGMDMLYLQAEKGWEIWNQ